MEISNGQLTQTEASVIAAAATPPSSSIPLMTIITNPTLTGNPNTNVSLGASANNALD